MPLSQPCQRCCSRVSAEPCSVDGPYGLVSAAKERFAGRDTYISFQKPARLEQLLWYCTKCPGAVADLNPASPQEASLKPHCRLSSLTRDFCCFCFNDFPTCFVCHCEPRWPGAPGGATCGDYVQENLLRFERIPLWVMHQTEIIFLIFSAFCRTYLGLFTVNLDDFHTLTSHERSCFNDPMLQVFTWHSYFN